MIVAENLSETILIGTDFLSSNSCILDFANLTMTIADTQVPLLWIQNKKQKRPRTFTVLMSKTVKIPPKTIARNIDCRLNRKLDGKRQNVYVNTSGIYHPSEKLLAKKFNTVPPSYILNVHKGKSRIDITNNNDYEIVIYKNQVLGKLEDCKQDIVNLLNHPQTDETFESINHVTSTGEIPDFSTTLFKKLNLDDKLDYLTKDQIDQLKQLVHEFQDIFYNEDTGDLPAANLPEHEIVLDTEKPIRVPYRQIPLSLKGEAEKLVEKMMKQDIIEPSNSPYHSPAFLIKRGKHFKIVVDYRQINRHVVRNFQPLPSIDTITSIWHDCKYWSTLDLHHAYFQVKLSEKSKAVTACSIPGVSFFQFKRVPLGISSAVGYFQGLIEKTLLGLKNNLKIVAYMDDIATGSNSFETMLSNLKLIFTRIRQVGLLLKPEKTKLFEKQIQYVGYELSERGLGVNKQKLEAVTLMEAPKNKRELKSFLGFCSFYRKHIKSHSMIVQPLTDLLKKDTKFIWGPKQQASFETIKQKLVTAPILQFPNLNKQFVLSCDASSTGIAAVLSQKSDDGKSLHPVAFASNMLSKSQSKWSAFQREFYALKTYCQKFKQYLLGRKFLVRTDNQALVHWQTFKDIENPKLWRWVTILSQFDFDIEYIPSHKNESDGPSRLHRSNDPINERSNVENSCAIALSSSVLKDKTPAAIDILNKEQLRIAQGADETLKTVIQWLKDCKRPELNRDTQKLNPTLKVYFNSFTRLKLIDGILYRTWERPNKETPDDLICVPHTITEKIISTCHDLPSGGHLGKPKTLAKIQSRFYWPRMEHEISLYIDACQTCIKKSQKRKPKSPLQPFNGTHPNDIVQFDLMENMPDNVYRYRSILVIIDRFTNWVEAVPLQDTKSATIARAFLDNWIARHGVPIQCHSDRGPNFTAEIMNIVHKLMGIHRTFTCAYRPQSDGAAEAAVKIIKNLLKGFCMQNPEKWPLLLQQCLFAYRTSKHSSTDYSPFFLHRGHAPRIPMDILFNTFNHKQFANQQEYAYDLYHPLTWRMLKIGAFLCARIGYSLS